MTFHKARDPGSLKAAVAKLVARCGGVKVATRVRSSALQQYSDASHKSHLPIDVMLELETRCGDPIVLRQLALEEGYLLVHLRENPNEPLALALSRITTETGQLLAQGAAALREKRCPPSEALLIKQTALAIAAACAETVADCDAVIGQDQGGAV